MYNLSRTAYHLNGRVILYPPADADEFSACEPIYEDFAGWNESTLGIKTFKQLPENAQNYLLRIEKLAGIPIDIISTGPDRNETIILRHPLAASLNDREVNVLV